MDGKEEMVYFFGEYEIMIEYIYSVEWSEVVEMLKVNSSGIYVIGMKWKDFGVGFLEDFQEWNGSWYEKWINIYFGKSFDYWFILFNWVNIMVDGFLVFVLCFDILIEF